MNPTNESIGRPSDDEIIRVGLAIDKAISAQVKWAGTLNRDDVAIAAIKALRKLDRKQFANNRQAPGVPDWQSVADQMAAAIAPGEWVMVPRKLTAANGAKGLLSGEFHETVRRTCDDCQGEGYDDDGVACEICSGECGFDEQVPVSWDTIKRLHDMIVANLSAPQPPAQEQGEDYVGVLNVRRHRGIDAMVNHDFEYLGALPDGIYRLYTRAAGAEDARDAEADLQTVIDHNIALQDVINDAIKIHADFGSTADMADWLRDAVAIASQAKEGESNG